MNEQADQAISRRHEQGEGCQRCGGEVITEVDERGRRRRICLSCAHIEAPALDESRIAIRRQARGRLPGGSER
jgi:hypothetical protein